MWSVTVKCQALRDTSWYIFYLILIMTLQDCYSYPYSIEEAFQAQKDY